MRKTFLTCLLLSILAQGYAAASNIQTKTPYTRAISSNEIAILEEKMIAEVNKVRSKHGLKPLKKWDPLTTCAREHSQNMASNRVRFSHQGVDQRAEKMIKLGNLRTFGENLAYSLNYKDPIKVSVEGWMKSPPHRENILADYDETGIGIAIGKDGKIYSTQLFAKRQKKK